MKANIMKIIMVVLLLLLTGCCVSPKKEIKTMSREQAIQQIFFFVYTEPIDLSQYGKFQSEDKE